MRDRTFRAELMPAEAPSRRRTPWLVGITVAILILIVLGFVAVRLSVDAPSLAAGNVPEDGYDARFVRHPWLTYLHIAPGVLYLVGAPLQLAYWFRGRHYAVHQRLGRILLGAGLLTGAMAVVIGLLFPSAAQVKCRQLCCSVSGFWWHRFFELSKVVQSIAAEPVSCREARRSDAGTDRAVGGRSSAAGGRRLACPATGDRWRHPAGLAGVPRSSSAPPCR
jgi:hypothetical protein